MVRETDLYLWWKIGKEQILKRYEDIWRLVQEKNEV